MWTNRVPDTVRDEHDRVHRDALSVSSGCLVDPGESEDEASRADAGDVYTREEAGLVCPRECGHKDRPEDVGDEVNDAYIGETTLPTRGDVDACIDCEDFNDSEKDRKGLRWIPERSEHVPTNAAKERSLERCEAERLDDQTTLVRKGVRDVVKAREKSEDPCLGINQTFDHPDVK